MTTKIVNIELDYDPQAHQTSDAVSISAPGGYIGSGNGFATGDIEGSVSWDLYEDQAPDKCDASFVGTITSKRGEEFRFQTRGILFAPTIEEPGIYRTNSEVAVTSTEPVENHLVGDWIGTFDSTLYHHSYVVTLANTD